MNFSHFLRTLYVCYTVSMNDRQNINFPVERDLHDYLKRKARLRYLSMSQLIAAILRKEMKRDLEYEGKPTED